MCGGGDLFTVYACVPCGFTGIWRKVNGRFTIIAKLVSSFTSVEYFSMAVLGISLLAGVSGESLAKGIMSGMLGIFTACIGMDAVTGVSRFTFGIKALQYGIDMLPAMIALVALTQVVEKLAEFKLAGEKGLQAGKIDKQGLTRKEMLSIIPASLRSTIIASFIGAMPEKN